MLQPPTLPASTLRRYALVVAYFALVLAATAPGTRAGDVTGYGLIKGQFFIQTGPDTLIIDPLFGFSLVASVDLDDFDLLSDARFENPDGALELMDDLGPYWAFVDSYSTWNELNEAQGWGDYTIRFDAVNDGSFSCAIAFPESPLPPQPRLTNFAVVQAADPSQPLRLEWDFSAPPEATDFVQIYINLGHSEVFATPNSGEAGALDGTSRSFVIPAGTFDSGLVYSLNLEISRTVATNTECYPHAAGALGTFSSTEAALITVKPPVLRILSRPANDRVRIEAVTDPRETVILEASGGLGSWLPVATNAAPSGTNVFEIPMGDDSLQFFRAALAP
jgi:hypothetical protein